MAKIINSTFVSLDGVVNHMERWHFDYVDEESGRLALEQLQSSRALLMGRHTYEVYAGAWPSRSDELADRINAMPKYVASTTLTDPAWKNTTVVSGDLVSEAAKLKANDGDILMHGYGPVAKTLLKHGLLDELHLWVHPVLAGVGESHDMVLTPDLNVTLRLLDIHRLGSGVVVLSYAADAA